MFEKHISDEMKPWRDFLLIYKFAVEDIKTKLDILDDEFGNIHAYNPIEHIRHRVKKRDSIIEKLERLGIEPTIENAKKNIFDIAGIRIICAFTADIYNVVELISKHPEIKVIEIKDYIENPKPNGYRSLHLHIEYPVFMSHGTVPTRVEIQLRTIAMDFWASVEHKIYYKYREQTPNDIQVRLKECANVISELDDQMFQIKKEIKFLENLATEASENDFYRDKNDNWEFTDVPYDSNTEFD